MPDVTKPFSPERYPQISFLHLLWMNIPGNETLMFTETANYHANVAKTAQRNKNLNL